MSKSALANSETQLDQSVLGRCDRVSRSGLATAVYTDSFRAMVMEQAKTVLATSRGLTPQTTMRVAAAAMKVWMTAVKMDRKTVPRT